MKAYPLAMLEKAGWECTTKLPTALDPVPENKKQVNIHLSIATSIKNTSKLAVVRVAISRRVKHAIELIIARGANVGTTTVRGIVFDDNEAKEMGPKWVLNGMSYQWSSATYQRRRQYRRLDVHSPPHPQALPHALS